MFEIEYDESGAIINPVHINRLLDHVFKTIKFDHDIMSYASWDEYLTRFHFDFDNRHTPFQLKNLEDVLLGYIITHSEGDLMEGYPGFAANTKQNRESLEGEVVVFVDTQMYVEIFEMLKELANQEAAYRLQTGIRVHDSIIEG